MGQLFDCPDAMRIYLLIQTNCTSSVYTLPAIVHPTRAAYCDYVADKDCAFIPDMTHVCGTNGHTYRNE